MQIGQNTDKKKEKEKVDQIWRGEGKKQAQNRFKVHIFTLPNNSRGCSRAMKPKKLSLTVSLLKIKV